MMDEGHIIEYIPVWVGIHTTLITIRESQKKGLCT